MRPLDQINADFKKATDAKLRFLERASVVSFSVAIIGIAVLIGMHQALEEARQQIKIQPLKQEIARHG